MIKSSTSSRHRRAVIVGCSLLVAGLVVAGLIWYFGSNQPALNSDDQSAPVESAAPTGDAADKEYNELKDRSISESSSEADKAKYYGDLGEVAVAAGECRAAADAATELDAYNSVRALSVRLGSVDCFIDASDTASAEAILATAESRAQSIDDAQEREDALGLINMKRFEIGQ